MAGLIDSTTGLAFGVGLQWQTPIGGGGLDIVTDPAGEMITETSIAMIDETGQIMITEA
jgi:hypothetical protein